MRSIIFGLLVLALSGSNAFANCGSDQATCSSMCVLSSALTKQFGGGNDCINNCLTAATACEAREEQQRQMEQQRQQMQQQQQQQAQQQQAQQQQQRQQAAERQAQQERDAKEIGGKQQRVQQANEVAQRVGADAAIQQQFDAAMEKGMQAIDQKGYVSAEYQFKAALKIKPKDVDAKAGLLRAIMGSGRRAAAITYANEQLLALASQPSGSNGQSAYAQWLAVLSDNGLANDAERSQLERIYPFGGGDPERAAASFPGSNPKSAFLPFVRQIASVIPAIRADYADRRKAVSEREEVEDAQWKEAQKNATHAAMQSYLTRYPTGRYVAQARKKDEEYQRPPPRPNLPFAVDESIWRTLEASEMYRNLPRPRALRSRSVYQKSGVFTNPQIPPIAPYIATDKIEVAPLGEKCANSKMSTERVGSVEHNYNADNYNCGGIEFGFMIDGKPFPSFRSLGPLSGSLYPPRIGAEQNVQFESAGLEPTFDSRSTTRCRITGRIEANQLNSRLTGTAWVVRCNFETKFIGGHVAKPIVSESEDYLIEDLGIRFSAIGALNWETNRYVIPAPGFQTVSVDPAYRETTIYRSHEWAVGEVGALSAPPLAR